MENEMNEKKTMRLRLPVQVAVDRTTAYGTLADGTGVDVSQDLVGAPVRVSADTLPPLSPTIMQIDQGPCIRSFGRWLC
jgi:hypothetical protein